MSLTGRTRPVAAGWALLLACAAAGTAGCSAASAGDAAGESRTVTVLAAASLTEAFTELAARFEQAHPGTQVRLSFGPSPALAQQVAAGAPADVLAVASPEALAPLRGGGTAGPPRLLARNRLQLAVPADNPGGVSALADLADPALDVALCAPEVPCGAAAAALLGAAGVVAAPDTLERDAKATLARVVLGEVDAALVYRTDVRAAGAAVRGIEVADSPANDYVIAGLAGAPEPAGAAAFVELALSGAGREVLAGAGFEVP